MTAIETARPNPGWLVVLWFVLLLWLLVSGGPDDPPSPTSPAIAQGSVINGAPVEYADEYAAPLTYEERFSPEAIGPPTLVVGSDWAWAEAACEGCPIATAAVHEQGIGE